MPSKTTTKAKTTRKSAGLLERLAAGPVICAEGYLFEFERRGYLQAGAFVPEVVLEHPDLVAELHREFVHAGSDVVEAFTYYAHREKLRVIGRERDLEKINKHSTLPAVVTLAIHREDATREGWSVAETCKRLEDAGADVVGLNCARGPQTMLPLLEEVRKAVKVPIAALPVPYRTTKSEPNFQSLTDPHCDCLPREKPFPTGLDPFTCNRWEIAEFTKAAYAMGVRYLGVCCGAGPHHIRAMAEALGRKPAASRYTEDMSKHYVLGSHKSFRKANTEYRKR